MKVRVFSVVCFALCLFGAAVPGRATTILTQDLMSIGGDITSGVGSMSPVTGFTNVVMDTLTITGAPNAGVNGVYTGLYLQENFNPTTDTLTVSGSLNCVSCTPIYNPSVVTIETIVFSGDLTANASAAGLSINPPPSVVSISIGSALAADLGLSTTSFNSLYALTDSGTSGVPGNAPASSASLGISTVPEPASWRMALFAFGLIIGLSRRRFARAN